MLNLQINKLRLNSKMFINHYNYTSYRNFSKVIKKNLFNQYFKSNQSKSYNKKFSNIKFFSEKIQSKNNTENPTENTNDDKKNEEYISFGYKTVKKEDRQDMVNSVFANVAKRFF